MSVWPRSVLNPGGLIGRKIFRFEVGWWLGQVKFRRHHESPWFTKRRKSGRRADNKCVRTMVVAERSFPPIVRWASWRPLDFRDHDFAVANLGSQEASHSSPSSRTVVPWQRKSRSCRLWPSPLSNNRSSLQDVNEEAKPICSRLYDRNRPGCEAPTALFSDPAPILDWKHFFSLPTD